MSRTLLPVQNPTTQGLKQSPNLVEIDGRSTGTLNLKPIHRITTQSHDWSPKVYKLLETMKTREWKTHKEGMLSSVVSFQVMYITENMSYINRIISPNYIGGVKIKNLGNHHLYW